MAQIGRVTLQIPPGPGNPRNSEGAFYTLQSGRMLFIYSKFDGDSHDDDAHSCIACRTSDDEGESWSGDRILFTTEDHQAKNVMSVSMLAMKNGDVGLFYLVRHGWHDTRLHLRRSSDQGLTWGEAEPCILSPGYYVTNNDRVIRLATGRILVPANLHRIMTFDTRGWQSYDGRGIPCSFYSDDDGRTWRESRGYCFISLPHSRSGFQESGVIELRSGAVYQWMRTDVGCQYEALSADGGETWSVPVPSRFSSPCSPLSMKRVPGTGALLAVWNPIPDYIGRKCSPVASRNPLVMATSADDGKTWSQPAVLEDAPEHGYCYTAIHFTADSVLLAYCAGGPEDGSILSRNIIRKIPFTALP